MAMLELLLWWYYTQLGEFLVFIHQFKVPQQLLIFSRRWVSFIFTNWLAPLAHFTTLLYLKEDG